ncbi:MULTISPECIES: response regulator [Vogesella]|jgi:two-component system response regulator TctD|uniref:Response regulator n=2 Tax=Vogesella TaxID=57739 RepID=A0A495BHZ9_VOGIN|nr:MULTISPECIES: response regulator [Vogesella]KMJ53665.1 transcriptional regulator [Vogesella sp. EB]MCQ4143527.1 response regulator [Vogesella sp. AC12]MDC7689580.1 response regulator [Vogesella indigofera]MDC7700947.1 response regulator [Vogesella indigofera]MDC7703196.1 response regulator [Vogesella indigofera]
MRIILIEDQPDLAHWLARALTASGYVVDVIGDGIDADNALKTEEYDLAILDMNLPRLSGETILQRLRARHQTLPVLVLTARGELSDKVKGLEMGADDYLVKPFELDELEARLKALLRRHQGHENAWLQCGDLRYSKQQQFFELAGKLLTLTRREHTVLEVLIRRKGQPLNRERLFNQVFTLDDNANQEAIEVYIHRLRKKLDGSNVSITTLRGLGYLLEQRDAP